MPVNGDHLAAERVYFGGRLEVCHFGTCLVPPLAEHAVAVIILLKIVSIIHLIVTMCLDILSENLRYIAAVPPCVVEVVFACGLPRRVLHYHEAYVCKEIVKVSQLGA